MSKILRRPMFRGGGKVSSYGNGIATGLADGGRVNLELGGSPFGAPITKVPQAAYDSGRAVTGGSIMNRIRNIPYLGKMIPAAGGAISKYSPYGAAAVTGTGLGSLADFFAKSTDTPEGYRRRKEMGGANFNFDETNLDVGEVFDYIDEGNKIGEAPGFFPRGGKDKFYEEQGYLPDGTKIKVEEEVDDGSSTPTLEERIAKIQAEERARYEDMINKAMGTGDKKSAKEQIAENKEIFEEAMGGGKKAMIDDLSTMGLSYAAGALKEGATVKSSFADFFEKESQRPSRKSKVSDAASNAAIQAYLTGEKSYNDLMKALKVNQAGIDYKMGVENAAKKALTYEELKTLNKQTSTTKKNKTAAQTWLNNQSKEIGQNFLNPISSKDNTEELFVKENVGEYFLDEDSGEFFQIVIIDGAIGKKRIP